MYRSILFALSTNTTPDGIHMHIILFHDAIKDGRLAAILVVKEKQQKSGCRTRPQPFLSSAFTDLVQTWQTDKERGLPYARQFFSKMADWRPF